MSLLTLVQDSADRLGIVRPSTVIGSADQQVRQLAGLANQEGKELARRHPWQYLTKEKTFTSVALESQSTASAVPSDFDRFVNGTFYNRTSNRRVEGPLTSQEWQAYKASTATVLYDAFRMRGNDILLAPTPSAGSTYAYEYISTYWVATAGASTTPAQAAWAADTDVGLLAEEIMTLGVVWRFLKAKGLDYSEPFRTYEAQVMIAMAKDGGKRSVYMGKGHASPTKPRTPTWPDGSWALS